MLSVTEEDMNDREKKGSREKCFISIIDTLVHLDTDTHLHTHIHIHVQRNHKSLSGTDLTEICIPSGRDMVWTSEGSPRESPVTRLNKCLVKHLQHSAHHQRFTANVHAFVKHK